MPGGGLDKTRAAEYERWRKSPERQREAEAAEAERKKAAEEWMRQQPEGWRERENNPLIGRMMKRRAMGRRLEAARAPFESERAKLQVERDVAVREALRGIDADFSEKMAEINQRQAKALAKLEEEMR